MKTGIELIVEERQEQIEKHKWTKQHDRQINDEGELVQAAEFCLKAQGRGVGFDDGWPYNWSHEYRRKILNKDLVSQLKIAGALYMAENDRLNEPKYWKEINLIAAEIDTLHNNCHYEPEY